MRPTVLMVEDEVGLCRRMAQCVAYYGFDVLQAHGLAEARTILEERRATGKDLCAVYLDLGLGDENGADLIPLVEKSYPAARIIVVSGHIDDGFLDAKTALEVQRHGVILPKPVGPDELAAALRRRPPTARGVSVHEIAESLGFSRRQGLILDGLLQHKANKELAAELD